MQKSTTILAAIGLAVPTLAGGYYANQFLKQSIRHQTEANPEALQQLIEVTPKQKADATTQGPYRSSNIISLQSDDAARAKQASPTERSRSKPKISLQHKDLSVAPQSEKLVFDVARVDPDGLSVFAGRAAPNAEVTILVDGKPVSTSFADKYGEWTAIVEHEFAPDGDYQLSLRQLAKGEIKKQQPAVLAKAGKNQTSTADAVNPLPGSSQQSEGKSIEQKIPAIETSSNEMVPSRDITVTEETGQKVAALAETHPVAAPGSKSPRLETQTSAYKPETGTERTADAVASRLMQNLEDLVASARTQSKARMAKKATLDQSREPEPNQIQDEIRRRRSYRMATAGTDGPQKIVTPSQTLAALTDREMNKGEHVSLSMAEHGLVKREENQHIIGTVEPTHAIASPTVDPTSASEMEHDQNAMSVNEASTISRLRSQRTHEDRTDKYASIQGEDRLHSQMPTIRPSKVQSGENKMAKAYTKPSQRVNERAAASTIGEQKTRAGETATSADDRPDQSLLANVQPKIKAVVPVPIQFVFEQAKFTPRGEKAAALLLEYVKLKSFKSITLSGHADERGHEIYNHALSHDRLKAVAGYLRKGGFEGELKLIPRGESEPFSGINREHFELEDLYQLDRRVELYTEE